MKNPVKSNFLYLIGAFFLLSVAACSQKNKLSSMGPPPVIDSPFVIAYINSEPKFKGQLYWAKEFYKERKFQLGWFKDHKVVPQAQEMLTIIKHSNEEGLDSADYQIKDFDKLFADLEKAKKDTALYRKMEKDIDLALSSTYFVWATDFYRGRVIPKESENVQWDIKRNKVKLHKALATVLNFRKSKYDYADFLPLHKDYSNLKKALANYRKIKAEGGWPVIPQETRLKPGETSPVVSVLQKRLLNKPSDESNPQSNKYEGELVEAVKSFQKSLGLNPDGKLDKETVRLLNIPVDDRIKTIVLNMERWRWIPKSFEPDYLLVNIPEYRLHVYEKGQEKINMKVIVGKTMNSTPIFSDKLEYVVLSPYWNVPMSIIQKELAPKLIGNPGYLDRLDMEVVTAKGEQIDPSSIDWASVSEDNFKYIVRRRPGPKNDLGDVKFIFPNTDNIYLHDTPHDELFSQEKRGFSHGCVRVEKPVDLAVYLLRNIQGYDRSKIQSIIANREEKYVSLKEKLPVYLIYLTAWADENGNVNFRDDIYGHDKTLAARYYN